MRFARAVLLLGLGLLTTSCVGVRMAYQWADTFVVQRIESVVHLSKDQKKLVKRLVREELRRAFLQGYPTWVEMSREHFRLLEDPGRTYAHYVQFSDRVEQSAMKMLVPLEPAITEFALSLSAEQWSEVMTSLRRKLDKRVKDLNSEEDRQEKSERRFASWAQWSVGKIDLDSDRALAREVWEAKYPWTEELRNRGRLLTQMHDAAKSPESLKQFIHTFCTQPLSLRIPEFAAAHQAWKQRIRVIQWKTIRSTPMSKKTQWIAARKELLKDLESLWKEEGERKIGSEG